MILLKYEHSHEVIVDSKEWHHKEGYNLGAKAQLKKVVEHIKEQSWLSFNAFDDKIRVMWNEEWEAILKEVE